MRTFPFRACISIGLGLVVLLAGACGNDQTDAQRAAELLQQGLTAHAAGNMGTAISDYRQVLVLDPQNKYAYYNLGLIDQTRGNAAAAEQNYRIALGIDPNYVPALFNLAIIQTSAGADQEAVALYRRAIQANPGFAAAHLNLGLLLIDTGDKAGGEAEIDLAVALDPSLGSRVPASDLSPQPSPST